jgi:serine phosphatase RsbU (regulator of sigma subunit)/ligand-binding sensor domain-containing protein
VYRKNPADAASLPDNYVFAITEDRKGRLWMGTAAGLVMFDPAREKFTHIPLSIEKDGADITRVDDVELDNTGRLWVCVYGMRLFSLDVTFSDVAAIQASMRIEGPALFHISQEVNRLRRDKLGRLCFLNEDGLHVLDEKKQKWRMLAAWKDHVVQDANNGKFAFSTTQSDSTIWVVSSRFENSQLFHLSSDGRTVLSTMRFTIDGINQYIRDMVEGPDGALYLISFEHFIRYDVVQHTYTSIPANKENRTGYSGRGNHLFVQPDGMLWISTSGYGINTFDPLTLAFNSRPEPLHNTLFAKELEAFDQSIRKRTGGEMRLVNSVFPLRLDDGSLWCGTLDHGLLYYDARTGAVRHYGVNKNDPYSFLMMRLFRPFVDSKGRVWVGNRQGISRLTNTAEQWEHFWFDPDGPDLTLLNNHVTCWHEEADGGIWMGTVTSGLVRFSPDSKQFTFFRNDGKDSASISDNHVLSIARDPRPSEQSLWIGTDGGGLNRFDLTTQRFVRYGERQGLPNPVVYGILADSSAKLWMSTNAGLCRFDPATGRFRHYDARDGLQANEFNRFEYYRIGKHLYFGGVDGYNVFDPARILSNRMVPKMALTSFRLFNKEVLPGAKGSPLAVAVPYVKHITLAHDQNMFSIEFSSLDFRAHDRNRYRYRLDGFTEGWIDAGTQRSATFTNLDPGEYVFQVIGSNNHGVWNATGVQLRITIDPPWWLTWWAYMIYGVLVIGAFLSIDRYQRRRLITRERERSRYRETELRADAAELEARAVRAENDRKQKEMQIAAVIQQRVLPQKLPRIPGYDLAGINLPADEIGGDYYDCIQLMDGRIALAVADVTGKGVPASLLVNSLHASLRVHLDNAEELPTIVQRLNDFFYNSTPPSSFITFLIALLEPGTGKIDVINAGHNPALINRNGSVTDTMRSRNLPLGCVPSKQLPEIESYTLNEGDGLLVFTDGITEAMNTRLEPYGQDALEALFIAQRAQPAAMLLGTIVAELKHYTMGADQSDDITALFLRRVKPVG